MFYIAAVTDNKCLAVCPGWLRLCIVVYSRCNINYVIVFWCLSCVLLAAGNNLSKHIYIYMSLCQKVLGEDHPFFGPKCFFRFKFSLNKPNFIWKSMHQRDNKDKLDSQSQFWVSKIWKFTPSLGWKSAKEGWTFRVHRFSCRFVCIFLL